MSSIAPPEAGRTAGEAGPRPDAQALIAEARANRPLPVTPGTVTVVRGRITSKPVGPGTWRIVYPNGPVLAREHIRDNHTQTFRFALPPAQYVLEGSYDARNISTARQLTVTAGKITRVSLPSICK